MAKAARESTEPGTAAIYGRLLGAFGALVAGAVAITVVVLLLHGLEPITATATTSQPATATTSPATTTPATSSAFPAPPKGAIVLAAQAGADALGLAITPGTSGIGLQASVVGYPNGVSGGIRGLDVHFRVTSRAGKSQTTGEALLCGAGCYRTDSLIADPAKVVVILGGHKPAQVPFTLPTVWPPPPAQAKVARAAQVWLGLKTLVFHDRLSAGGGATLNTLWKIVAPDKLAYDVKGGGSSVIIGDQRWDKPAGGTTWQESQQSPVQQPQPFWVSATNAHLLGTVLVRGRPAWRISFYDPGTPGWFTILVDKATMHTVDIQMTAVAHFMHDTYGPFNAPISITPPK